jgi:hypothetical protein
MYQHIFDRGGPLAYMLHKPFPLCLQWYLQAADAAVEHHPDTPLDGHPYRPAPANHLF